MTELEIAVKRLKEVFEQRFERQRQVSYDAVIENVVRDANGQAVSATATIDGVPNVPVIIPYGARIRPGMTFTAVNFGTLTSPSWVLSGPLSNMGIPRVF